MPSTELQCDTVDSWLSQRSSHSKIDHICFELLKETIYTYYIQSVVVSGLCKNTMLTIAYYRYPFLDTFGENRGPNGRMTPRVDPLSKMDTSRRALVKD